MKQHHVLFAAEAAGVAGFILRFTLYTRFVDEKGLLMPTMLMHILWLLTAAWIAAAAVLAFRSKLTLPAMPSGMREGAPNAFALGILLSVTVRSPKGGMEALRPILLVLGIAAAAGLLISSLRARQGKPGSFLMHVLPVVFMALYMISRYRVWSARPQIMDHAFDMLACVSILLSLYWRCAHQGGSGNQRRQTFYSLCAAFLCITAMAHGEAPLLYFSGGMYALTCGERL